MYRGCGGACASQEPRLGQPSGRGAAGDARAHDGDAARRERRARSSPPAGLRSGHRRRGTRTAARRSWSSRAIRALRSVNGTRQRGRRGRWPAAAPALVARGWGTRYGVGDGSSSAQGYSVRPQHRTGRGLFGSRWRRSTRADDPRARGGGPAPPPAVEAGRGGGTHGRLPRAGPGVTRDRRGAAAWRATSTTGRASPRARRRGDGAGGPSAPRLIGGNRDGRRVRLLLRGSARESWGVRDPRSRQGIPGRGERRLPPRGPSLCAHDPRACPLRVPREPIPRNR